MATGKITTNRCYRNKTLLYSYKVNRNYRKCLKLIVRSKALVCCLCFIVCVNTVASQYPNVQTYTERDPRFYSREGVDYQPANPGDENYRTYFHNNRRYGYYQPNGYGAQYPGQVQPNQYPGSTGLGDDKFKFDPNNPKNIQTPFPGVLGGWREDLQGKLRRDSILLDRDVFVTTNYGQIQGFKTYLYDSPDPKSFYRPWHSTVDRIMGECSTFLGIPYALPPTFEGRFKPPRPHRGWQLLQAVDYGPACPQPVKYTGFTKGINDMAEDCLYLNIFSPNTKAGVAQKFPVMVYIHGGDFIKGASNLFPGHVMAAFYEVVVVTFNYRLGALGFFSTGDENSPGNYGALDQVAAIRWIHDNIEFFNGDRRSITLFGPDSGAASAGILMVHPQTRDIVTKVIAQSGSALADQSFIVDKYRAQNTSRVFGQLVGCSIESSWKLVNCLSKGRSFYELANAEFAPHVGLFPWGPVLDANFTFPADDWYEGWRERDFHFLSETPEELIRKGLYNHGLHYLSGVTTQEAAFIVYQNDSLSPYYEIDKQFFEQKVKEMVLRYNYTLNPIGVYEAIKYMYTYWPDPNNKTHIRDQYIHLLSDFLYRAPTDKIIKLLVERKIPVYTYVMNTTIESLKFPEWRKYPHDIENYFLTGAPFMDVEFYPKRAKLERNGWTDNDRNMSHFFMKTYTDFARFGNPTVQQVLGIHFEKATNGELKYLNLNTTFNSSILLNYRQTECAFWSSYLPTVVGMLVATYPPSTEFWWEPREPLQIAFWSMSAACMFLLVLVVVCCIMYKNAKRESDRLYDGDFMHPESEINEGVDNNIIQGQPLRLNANIYEYRDSPSKYPKSDALSIRSPSSLGMTQTTKIGSQSSLRSAISLKEQKSVTPPPSKGNNFDKNLKYSERNVNEKPDRYTPSDNKSLLSSGTATSTIMSAENQDFMTSSPIDRRPTTPISYKNKSTAKITRSQFSADNSIPQTEV